LFKINITRLNLARSLHEYATIHRVAGMIAGVENKFSLVLYLVLVLISRYAGFLV